MNDVYSRIESLCAHIGKDITTMCKEATISRAILSEFKMGRTKKLSTDTISKLAKYFKVSTDYLLGNDDAPDKNGRTEAHKNKAPDAVISGAEALRIYAEGKKGGPLTLEELNRLDKLADLFIEGLNK